MDLPALGFSSISSITPLRLTGKHGRLLRADWMTLFHHVTPKRMKEEELRANSVLTGRG